MIYHDAWKSFNLALISIALPLGDFKRTEKDGCVLWPLRDDRLEEMRARYVGAIENLPSGVDMAVFGEMTYPAGTDVASERVFADKLAALASERNLYIIAGSAHQTAAGPGKHFNTCSIFHPHSRDPVCQNKFSRAKHHEELIDIPEDPDIQVICAPFASFAVTICLDVDNVNVWMKMRHRNNIHKLRNIDFLVIPAYDPSGKISGYARRWGQYFQAPFAYLNAHGGAKPSEAPFVQSAAGGDLAPFKCDTPAYYYQVTSAELTGSAAVLPYDS